MHIKEPYLNVYRNSEKRGGSARDAQGKSGGGGGGVIGGEEGVGGTIIRQTYQQ